VSSLPKGKKPGLHGFRTKLLAAMMLVVSVLTLAGLSLAQRKVAADAERGFRHDLQGALAALLHSAQQVRQAVLAERCRTLVRRPRIHAALEDDALDLLYLNAADELRDVMEGGDEPSGETLTQALHARFYRFLDRTGAVVSPPDPKEVGALRPEEEAQLALNGVPGEQQIGYVLRGEDGAGEAVDQVIAVPIVSTETGEVIAALVLGFKTAELDVGHTETGIKSGIWLNGRRHLPALAGDGQAALGAEVTRAIARSGGVESPLGVRIEGKSHLLFYKQLNPGSRSLPAYEVCFYPLTGSLARLRQLQCAGERLARRFGGTMRSGGAHPGKPRRNFGAGSPNLPAGGPH
jgi:hypothetical protein